jgi:hypothetical protein
MRPVTHCLVSPMPNILASMVGNEQIFLNEEIMEISFEKGKNKS